MPDPDTVKKVGFVLGLLLGGYTVYRLLRNVPRTKTLGQAVKETVSDVIDVPVKIVEEAKKVVKATPKKKPAKKRKKKTAEFSKEKKEHPELPDTTIKQIVVDHEKKKSRSKGGRATAKLGKHKGHKTKKGLSNDQKLDSAEKHEKAYRKKKVRA